jgi:hypothetical protein
MRGGLGGGYPDIVCNELEVAPEITIIYALAVGYPAPDFPTNKLGIGRVPVAKYLVFLDGLSRGAWRTERAPA